MAVPFQFPTGPEVAQAMGGAPAPSTTLQPGTLTPEMIQQLMQSQTAGPDGLPTGPAPVDEAQVQQAILAKILETLQKDLNVDVQAKAVLTYTQALAQLTEKQEQGIPPEAQFELETVKAQHEMMLEQKKFQHQVQMDQMRLQHELQIKAQEAQIKAQTMQQQGDIKVAQAQQDMQNKQAQVDQQLDETAKTGEVKRETMAKQAEAKATAQVEPNPGTKE